jgi:PAS domain S-box-containing protein
MHSAGPVILAYDDYGLVILSVLISILAASAALALAERVAAAPGKTKLAWMLGGAAASGIGCWSMHFTAMRAFSLPVTVLYHWPTVLASLIPPSVGFAAAFRLLGWGKTGRLQIVLAGIFVGGGIAGLHFTEMASMLWAGIYHVSAISLILPVILTLLLSVVSLGLTYGQPEATARRIVPRLASILALGAANPVMHFGAMAGTTFTQSPVAPDLSHAVSISILGLRVFSIIPLMILTVALTASLVDQLRKERVLLDELLEQAPQALVLTETDNRILRVNGEFTQTFGYAAREALNHRLDELIVPDDLRDEVRKQTELVSARGQRVEMEGIRRRKDGSRLHASIIRVPVALPGKQTVIYTILSDITERKRAEDDLRKQKEILQKVFDNAPVMIAFLGPDGRLKLANTELQSTLGWTQEEMLVMDVNVLIAELFPDPRHREDAIEFMSSASRKFAGLTVRVKDGRIIDTAWGKVRITDGTEIYIGRNITQRKRAEEDLRRSESFLAQAQQLAHVGSWAYNPSGHFDHWSQELFRIFGFDPVLGAPTLAKYLCAIHPNERDSIAGTFAEMVAQGKGCDVKQSIIRPDGEPRFVRFVGTPVFEDGILKSLVGTAMDVTEEENLTQALRRSFEEVRMSEERWRGIFENSSVGIALTDCGSTRFQAVNLAFQKMVGYSEEELRGVSFMDITHEGDRDPNRKFHAALLEGRLQSYAMEKRYWRKDGTLIWVNLHVSLIPGTESVPHCSQAIVEDITERKHAEEALRDSEERFRTVFENAGVGMALVDLEGRPFKTNPTLRQILGYGEEEFRGMIFTEFTHLDDQMADEKLYYELAAGRREKYEIEKRYLKKNGAVVWGLLVVSLVKDQVGRPMYAVGMVEDITERKRAEEELQQSRDTLRALAAHLQRIREEERTRVAREIHDELGQALTAIKIDLSSLTGGLPADRKKQSESILKLVDGTIQSVRRIATELRPVILDEFGLVAAVEWGSEEFQTRTGIKCRLHLPQDDIVIDPERATALFRIFQETMTNVARHANATKVSVRLAKVGRHLTLEIHDNGTGVGEEQLSASSSLGIMGMRERALLLGGELTIFGPPGEGTTVRVHIPETHHASLKEGK